MSVEVAKPLQLKRDAGRRYPVDPFAKPRRRLSLNAQVGMGLWVLLWLGYNTDIGRAMSPQFPANAADLIHGVRAFFPMLAAWFASLIILSRLNRLLPWLVGPLGLIFFFTILGLVPSATLSINPTYALYFGANYLAIILVLLAIVLVDNPLADLRSVLKVTWAIGTLFTIGLLGAIPILGSAVLIETETGPVGIRAYSGAGQILGMATTRNTGFARYAAISALVALPGLMKKGKPSVRVFWGILLTISLYALIIANGRTETVSFLAGLAVILGAERTKRFVNFLVATAGALLLGLRGFYSEFYLYFTRTGHLDITMTGRTLTWEEGWRLLWKSPWVGFGFQADRLYMTGHAHNAFLQVLIQSGFLGGVAILIALAITSYYIVEHFFLHPPPDKSLIPPEIPAVFLFMLVSSATESTFAYYSATWLLSAPIVAYVVALHVHLRRVSVRASQERAFRFRLGNRKSRVVRFPRDLPPFTPGGGIPV